MQCVYFDVLAAFPHLCCFFTAASLTVIGVEGIRIQILGMLFDVLIYISIDPVHVSDIVRTIFQLLYSRLLHYHRALSTQRISCFD